MIHVEEKQLEKYLKLEEEINGVNLRRFKASTRSIYKRNTLKFIRILLENNIQISSVRNVKTEHLKSYAAIELEKGRKATGVITDLRGVVYYYNYLNRSVARFRRYNLIDLRILQKQLEGGAKNEDK